jgi:glycosyltransferase involved in cell wall biosynthesis
MTSLSTAGPTHAPRVLFVSGEYPPLAGGIGDYTRQLREALEQLGVVTSVLTLNGAVGERVHTVGRWGWRTNVANYAALEDADFVHIQYQAGAFAMHPVINLLPHRLARRAKLPTVTTFHDLRPPYLFPKAGRLRQALLRSMAAHSAAVIVTNPDDERTLRTAGVPTTRIPIGPNLPAPNQRHPRGRVPSVGFFGYPARSKGVEELLQALGRIDARRRPLLTFVGGPGRPSRQNDQLSDAQVDELAAQAGVEVRRTGYLPPQVASNVLAHDTLIALPFRDGASQRSGSLLGALQTGRIVVSTAPPRPESLGALAELPQLRLVPPGDSAALAEAIEVALTAMPAAAKLPTDYTWAIIAERHRDLYTQLLQDAGSAR